MSARFVFADSQEPDLVLELSYAVYQELKRSQTTRLDEAYCCLANSRWEFTLNLYCHYVGLGLTPRGCSILPRCVVITEPTIPNTDNES
jgi:hypothetical protein